MPKIELRPVASTPASAGLDVDAAIAAPRLAIEHISPSVDGGRFPAKGVVGQSVTVEADVFGDGHEQIAARLRWQAAGEHVWHAAPMQALGNDRWRAHFRPGQAVPHRFVIEAWIDVWASYCGDLRKKQQAGVVVAADLDEGAALIREAARRHREQPALQALLQQLDTQPRSLWIALLLDDTTAATMQAVEEQRFLSRSDPALTVDVERERAGFSAWYELFPRSQTQPVAFGSPRHGSFDDVITRLPAIRAMGFDVLYFPPIHPIGHAHRKGRNNSLFAAPGDPGSPYAIGSAQGGHDAVHPELGGIEAFRRLRVAAEAQGLELALDFAVQCSPDHPWLKEHPEWFNWRPDGSIKYAENPPKKYEDIVNVDFYAAGARPGLWLALRDVVEYWIGEGVHIFRVDNPHTKPLPFWQWLIADIRSRHPDTIFLSEAFTRPALMYRLAKIGFTQSYTYFTWRNDKAGLQAYLGELAQGAPRDFFRPHFFVNTPDINPHFLHHSGRPGFLIRAALAATMSGLWGVYSGFELCDGRALPNKEEYLDSEKYEIKPRPPESFRPGPDNIIAEISRLNHIRRTNPALHTHTNLRFHNAWNEQVLAYSKATAERDNLLLMLVSLDPWHDQDVHFEVPLWEFGLPDDGSVQVEELVGGGRFSWHGKVQHWHFSPTGMLYAIFRLRPLHGGEKA